MKVVGKMDLTLKQKQIDKICNADHSDPFSFLGIHRSPNPFNKAREYAIRAFLPNAKKVYITNIPDMDDIEAKMIDARGFFEGRVPQLPDHVKYRLKISDKNSQLYEIYDPYSFGPIMSDYDTFLFNEGNHSNAYQMLGSHIKKIEGVDGVSFAVWAPNAKRVSVLGEFNEWDGRRHPMRKLGFSGIFEIFIPSLKEYDLYKYEIKTQNDIILTKTDPYGFYNEMKPKSAAIVYDIDKFTWSDQSWISKRNAESSFNNPLSVYECHLQSWMRIPESNDYLSYIDIAPKLVEYLIEMGYTHVEFLPVMEHPFDGSWGYQVSCYYAATSRSGEPSDLMYLINLLHENNIGVILDWVPGHFPKDSYALEKFDGTSLYEYSDPLKAENKDWGTLVFNYERNEVKSFLVSNAIFWFEKFHVDGLRVDAVASMLYLNYSRKNGDWIPNKFGGKENLEAIDFLKHLNSVVFSYYPNALMIAEESTSFPQVTRPVHTGGLGFSYKWNMGWMNDFIKYLNLDPYFRKYNHNLITFTMMYHYSENYILPLSHDEVVHGKGSLINKIPGDDWQKFATLKTALGFMFAHPGKKLLFMGNDIAQKSEWNHDKSLDWHILEEDRHKGFHLYMKDLLKIYRTHKEFYELDFSPKGFEWINVSDSDRSIFSFIRYSKSRNKYLIFIFNFTPVVYNSYIVGVPGKISFVELLNSDSELYGGSNVGNLGRVVSQNTPSDSKPYSVSLNIPPLGSLILMPEQRELLDPEDTD